MSINPNSKVFDNRGIGEEIFSGEFKSSLSSGKRVSNEVLLCYTGKPTREYQISYLTLIICIGCIILDLYLILKYTSEKHFDISNVDFLFQVAIGILMMMFGLMIHKIFVNHELKIEGFTSYMFWSALVGLAFAGLALLIQGFIRSIKFSVLAQDYYIMFLTIAVSEEIFWRFGIQPVFKILFNFNINKVTPSGDIVVNKSLTSLVSSIIAIVLTALLFMGFHVFVYEDGIDLFVIFLVGTLFGSVFEVTKRADTPVLAHLFMNAVAGITLINQYFGGF